MVTAVVAAGDMDKVIFFVPVEVVAEVVISVISAVVVEMVPSGMVVLVG